MERNSTREARERLEFDLWLASVSIRNTAEDLAGAITAGDTEQIAAASARIINLQQDQVRIANTDPRKLARQQREEAKSERVKHRVHGTRPPTDYSDS